MIGKLCASARIWLFQSKLLVGIKQKAEIKAFNCWYGGDKPLPLLLMLARLDGHIFDPTDFFDTNIIITTIVLLMWIKYSCHGQIDVQVSYYCLFSFPPTIVFLSHLLVV